MRKQEKRIISQQLDKLIDDMGEIKTKLAVFDERQNNMVKDIEFSTNMLERQNMRITALENFRLKILGGAAVVGAVISATINYIQKKLG